MWAKCDDHVLKIEDEYWNTDLVAKITIEPFVINLASSDSDSDESESESDESDSDS